MPQIKCVEKCFILEACTRVKKVHDNGLQRKRIRIFLERMIQTNAHKKLAKQHYQTSSVIIEAINAQPNSQEIYEYIYQNLVLIINHFVYTGAYKNAVKHYKKVIEELKKTFIKEHGQ